MTAIMDKIFSSAGIPDEDLEAVDARGLLYSGMLSMIGFIAVMSVLVLSG